MSGATGSGAGHPAVAIYATPDGGSALVDLPLPLAGKLIDDAGAITWTGIVAASGWGITEGHGPSAADWHVSNLAGLSIVLRGAWRIEASNGQTADLHPGSVLVMLDQTGQGHRSHTLEEPCTVIGIGFDAASHAQMLDYLAAVVG